MFESQMMDNIATFNNPWRDLVTAGFKAFLDSLSKSKQETTEENCDE